jgi:hypothetical protein
MMAMTTSSSINVNALAKFRRVVIVLTIRSDSASVDWTHAAACAFHFFMTKKNWFLLIALLALAGIYIFYFTGSFRPKTILIFHTSRNTRPNLRPRSGNAPKPETLPVTFGFGEFSYKLTEIALPLWHLISDSNSVPLNSFVYGRQIRGMRPAISGARPEPLNPDVTYRLFVTAGKNKGQHDFAPKAAN